MPSWESHSCLPCPVEAHSNEASHSDRAEQLQGTNLQRFRQRVARARLQLPTPSELIARSVAVDQVQCTLTECHQQFTEQRTELLAFLDKAIARNLPVRCSL
jgi:hypothetical protein